MRIGGRERDLLRVLPGELRHLVGSDDPASARLTPAAYRDDPEAEADYQLTVGAEILDAHRAALETLAESAAAEHLDEAQLQAWLRALEVMRLLVGTRLGVTAETEMPDARHPDHDTFVLYGYLSGLQDEIVGALSDGLGTAEDS